MTPLISANKLLLLTHRSSLAMTTRAVAAVHASAHHRAFSSHCAAAQKLKGVLEDYRREHFSRETPYRFKREILNAVQVPGVDMIEVDALNRILSNIGRHDQLLTEEELKSLLRETGSKDRCIKTSQMLELV